MSLAIASILKEEGFIEDFESYVENQKKYLLMSLKYIGKRETLLFVKLNE
jgi:ribosomal protein S8